MNLKHQLLPIVFLIFLFAPSVISAQLKQVSIEDMQVSWKFKGEYLYVQMNAPLQGWVALGFNDQNNIVRTDLVMVAVSQNRVEHEEFFVVGMGNPKPTSSLGGTKWVKDVSGQESEEGTSIAFAIHTTASKHHYELKEGQEIWLICAYSESDDFDHHSRKRRHIKVKL